MAELLVRVLAPHFCAGLVMRDGRCVEAAPILRWAVGRDRDQLRTQFAQRGWQAQIVKPHVAQVRTA